jgi:hypothetical protein
MEIYFSTVPLQAVVPVEEEEEEEEEEEGRRRRRISRINNLINVPFNLNV